MQIAISWGFFQGNLIHQNKQIQSKKTNKQKQTTKKTNKKQSQQTRKQKDKQKQTSVQIATPNYKALRTSA